MRELYGFRWIRKPSEKSCEILRPDVSITKNAPQKLGVQSLLGMKGYRHSPSGGILVDHMATTLTREQEPRFFQNGGHLSSRNPW